MLIIHCIQVKTFLNFSQRLCIYIGEDQTHTISANEITYVMKMLWLFDPTLRAEATFSRYELVCEK